MAAPVTGTFAATGNSPAIVGKQIAIDMTFAGVATVNIQWLVDGTNWRTITDGTFTASAQKIVEAPGIPIRLNCSAYTADVTYAMSVAGL